MISFDAIMRQESQANMEIETVYMSGGVSVVIIVVLIFFALWKVGLLKRKNGRGDINAISEAILSAVTQLSKRVDEQLLLSKKESERIEKLFDSHRGNEKRIVKIEDFHETVCPHKRKVLGLDK
jgi:hypothetical protein